MEPVRSSFGIELEGYVAWVEQDIEFQNPSPYEWNPSAGPLVLPAGVGDLRPFQRGGFVRNPIEDIVYRHLNIVVEGILASLPIRNNDHLVADPDITAINLEMDGKGHMQTYRRWSVKREYLDVRGRIPAPLLKSWSGHGRGWVGFELCSPAMWAVDASFEEVRDVIRRLNDSIWLLTPYNCGFHVHYGNGYEWIPLGPLRRMAGLFYAADALLVQLHPEIRRTYSYCRSNVMYSQLSHGATAADAHRLRRPQFIREETAPNEEHIPVREEEPVEAHEQPRPNGREPCCCWPSNFDRRPVSAPQEEPVVNPNARPSMRRESLGVWRRSLNIRRGNLATYPFDHPTFEELFDSSNIVHRKLHQSKGSPPSYPSAHMPILDGVREILKVTSSQEVDTLIDPELEERPAYNFQHYSGFKSWEGAPEKRTVEFRQAAAIFHGDIVSAWVRICVGLSEWAATAPLSEYMKVIHDCAIAAETQLEGSWDDPAWYDAFDLLAEIGLVNEGKIMYQFCQWNSDRLRRGGMPCVGESIARFIPEPTSTP